MVFDPYNIPDPTNQPIKRKRRWVWWLVLAPIAAVVIIACSTIGVSIAHMGQDGPKTAVKGQPLIVATSTPHGTTAPVSPDLTAKDLQLSVKILKKQCFGSAGCMITWKLDVAVDFDKLASRTYDITYEVTGDESGPITGTVTLDGESRTFVNEEQTASTASKSVKLKAHITDVEKNL